MTDIDRAVDLLADEMRDDATAVEEIKQLRAESIAIRKQAIENACAWAGVPVPLDDGRPVMTGITTTHGDKQRNALMLYMRAFRDTQHYLPTIADMAAGLGMQRTAVVWHLEMLRDEGRIDYVDSHMARSLKLLSQ